jgi:DNA-binding beta-propeller fold protein YncE
VYVADADNQLIRKITTGGVVSTFAGGGSGSPSINGTGTAAKFDNPTGIAVDSNGNVYVADAYDNMIRKIN